MESYEQLRYDKGKNQDCLGSTWTRGHKWLPKLVGDTNLK